MMNKIAVILLCLGLTGCVTINSINNSAKKVNYSDGVSKSEALIIARKTCMDDAYCRETAAISLTNIVDVYQNEKLYPGKWIVMSPTKPFTEPFPQRGAFFVDKKTGATDGFVILKPIK